MTIFVIAMRGRLTVRRLSLRLGLACGTLCAPLRPALLRFKPLAAVCAALLTYWPLTAMRSRP